MRRHGQRSADSRSTRRRRARGGAGAVARPEPELRALGVKRLRLFGSIARGERGPESDVDLLAEIDHSFRFSLIDLVGLQQDLEDLIGRKVEIATAAEEMRQRIRARVEADAIEIF